MSSLGSEFNLVFANYVNCLDDGNSEGAQQILQRYPQYAEELQSYRGQASSIHRRMTELVVESGDGSRFPSEHLPRRFGPYMLERVVGMGAMGDVYRAYHSQLDRYVALKLVRITGRRSIVERFKNEGMLSAKLIHPNIVRIYDVGEQDDRLYYTMDLVDGFNLRELATGSGLAHRDAGQLVSKIARATHHAHENGVVHRDIKPSNILVDRETHQPAIADFGLAKNLLDPQELTLTNELVGSPAYLAPELIRNTSGDINRAVDIYSLGATLYHVLSGQPPVTGASVAEILDRTATGQIRPLRELDRSIPKDLVVICETAMDPDPSKRYATALALAEDLERFHRNEPIQARPPSLTTTLSRWIQRNPAAAALLGFVAIALVASLFVAVRMNALRNLAEKEQVEAEKNFDSANNLSNLIVEILQSPDPSIDGRDVTVASRLDDAVVKATRELEDQPEQLGRFLGAIGRAYNGLGLYSNAAETHLAAVSSLRKVLNDDSEEFLDAESELADALLGSGEVQTALDSLERIRHTWESQFGKANEGYIQLLLRLASAYDAKSQYKINWRFAEKHSSWPRRFILRAAPSIWKRRPPTQKRFAIPINTIKRSRFSSR